MATQLDLLRNTDREADGAIADMVDLRERVLREVRRQLRRIGTDEDGKIDARAQLRNLLAVRVSVSRALVELGAPASVRVAEARSIRAAEGAVAILSRITTPEDAINDRAFMPDPDDIVARGLAGFSAKIADVFRLQDDAIRRAINAGVTAQLPLDDLILDIAGRIGTTFSRATAIVETAVVSVGRDIVVSTAGRVNERLGRDFFLLRYTGPLDILTRKFCPHILTETSRTFTEDAVAALDNGQRLPVETSCGGYRCRHLWAPVTQAQARQRGWAVLGAADAIRINGAWRAAA